MPLRIEPAQDSDRETIGGLLQFYLHDLSEFSGEEPEVDLLFPCPEWVNLPFDDRNHLKLVTLRGRPAGFARIVIGGNSPIKPQLTDLFLLRCYRQLGIGEEVLTKLLEELEGSWTIEVTDINHSAQEFFRVVLKRAYGKKLFEFNRPGSGTVVFEFSSAKVSSKS